MHQTDTTLTMPAAQPRAYTGAVGVRGLSTVWVVVALLGMVTLSTVVRILLGRSVHGPFVFMDELAYERMAHAFSLTGRFSLFGGGRLASPLYPFVISPIYLMVSSAESAYYWVKALNSVLLSLSVLPLYGMARSVLSRPWALGVAALSLLLPLMFYSDVALSENLAYPLVLVALWAMLRAVREPRLANDAVLGVAVLLAACARLQNVVLLPAALTALMMIPLLRPPSGRSRFRALGEEIARHRTLFGSCVGLVLFGVVKWAANGGALPLAGIYANVGKVHVRPLDVVELAVQHLAELDLALGVVPFAGAILAAYVLVRRGFPAEGLAFGAVAVSVTLWLLVEVAYAAAALDIPGSATASPRIHERYLIYVLPLFLIAFAASLRTFRLRVSPRVHLVIAAAATLLPAAIPFGRMINNTVPIDSLGLEMFAVDVHGKTQPIANATVVAVVIAAILASAYLYTFLRRRPRAAVATVVIFMLAQSALIGAVHSRLRLTGERASAANVRNSWVDASVKRGDVVLVSGPRHQRATLLLTAFHNLSITRVLATCGPVFGAGFGERQGAVGRGGVVLDGGTAVRASYVVAPVGLGIRGRVVARQPKAGLELVIPRGGVVQVGQNVHCSS
jgi:hypothetical protein